MRLYAWLLRPPFAMGFMWLSLGSRDRCRWVAVGWLAGLGVYTAICVVMHFAEGEGHTARWANKAVVLGAVAVIGYLVWWGLNDDSPRAPDCQQVGQYVDCA